MTFLDRGASRNMEIYARSVRKRNKLVEELAKRGDHTGILSWIRNASRVSLENAIGESFYHRRLPRLNLDGIPDVHVNEIMLWNFTNQLLQALIPTKRHLQILDVFRERSDVALGIAIIIAGAQGHHFNHFALAMKGQKTPPRVQRLIDEFLAKQKVEL